MTPTTLARIRGRPRPTSSTTTRKPRRRRASPVWWIVLICGVIYFVLPLLATFQFSLRTTVPFKAYTNTFNDPALLAQPDVLAFCAVLTIMCVDRADRADGLLGPPEGAACCGR